MLRHIAWFTGAQIAPDPQGHLTVADDEVRRRCLLPARELEELGVECSVFGNLDDADPVNVSKHLQKLQTEVVVVGKLACTSLIKLARAARHLGCYVVADFGEAGLQNDECAKLATFSDHNIVATEDAAEAFIARGLPVTVIMDSAEAPQEWLDCFYALKQKTPACANMNQPQAGHG